MSAIYDFTVKRADGTDLHLAELRGQVMLIVNTATKCGYAVQFDGLETLYNENKKRGFTVLGFPSDQFKQEPIDDDNMVGVCRIDFGVSFPMMAKVNVNGPSADPLYKFLKKQKGGLIGSSIKWNFTKFLVGRDGTVLARYGSATTPEEIEQDIVKALERGES